MADAVVDTDTRTRTREEFESGAFPSFISLSISAFVRSFWGGEEGGMRWDVDAGGSGRVSPAGGGFQERERRG
jgi:hypothetical protein